MIFFFLAFWRGVLAFVAGAASTAWRPCCGPEDGQHEDHRAAEGHSEYEGPLFPPRIAAMPVAAHLALGEWVARDVFRPYERVGCGCVARVDRHRAPRSPGALNRVQDGIAGQSHGLRVGGLHGNVLPSQVPVLPHELLEDGPVQWLPIPGQHVLLLVVGNVELEGLSIGHRDVQLVLARRSLERAEPVDSAVAVRIMRFQPVRKVLLVQNPEQLARDELVEEPNGGVHLELVQVAPLPPGLPLGVAAPGLLPQLVGAGIFLVLEVERPRHAAPADQIGVPSAHLVAAHERPQEGVHPLRVLGLHLPHAGR
mmetsp:Transcript_34028/g.100275  ORF Transcript_34028/g.100275 Transcript_34028/m.100275 type:complete len:311 (-) Transcript_34028:361-1293(-)